MPFDETTGQLLQSLLIIAVPVAVFYFLLIRPQRKKDKAVAEMRKNLEVGDEVTTIGGIVGKVVSIKDDTVIIESGADKNRIRFKRWAIQSRDTIKSDE